MLWCGKGGSGRDIYLLNEKCRAGLTEKRKRYKKLITRHAVVIEFERKYAPVEQNQIRILTYHQSREKAVLVINERSKGRKEFAGWIIQQVS